LHRQEGLSQEKIGKRFGVCQAVIWRVLQKVKQIESGKEVKP